MREPSGKDQLGPHRLWLFARPADLVWWRHPRHMAIFAWIFRLLRDHGSGIEKKRGQWMFSTWVIDVYKDRSFLQNTFFADH